VTVPVEFQQKKNEQNKHTALLLTDFELEQIHELTPAISANNGNNLYNGVSNKFVSVT